jgi:hypothetical protein
MISSTVLFIFIFLDYYILLKELLKMSSNRVCFKDVFDIAVPIF